MKIEIKQGHEMQKGVKELFVEYGKMLSRSMDMIKYYAEVEALPGKYAPPDGILLVAECDGVPAGMIGVRRMSDKDCELKRMYMDPKCRGEGAGAALVRSAMKAARKMGYENMYVDNVGWLTAAIRMYKKLGFEEIEPYYENKDKDVVYFRRSLEDMD